MEARLTLPRRSAVVWVLLLVLSWASVACRALPERGTAGVGGDTIETAPAYLLTVRSDGPRWLGPAWWTALGVDTDGVDPQSVQLLRGEEPVPLLWTSSPDGPGALFYGLTMSSTVGPVGTYTLLLDADVPGETPATVPLDGGAPEVCRPVTRAALRLEEDLVYRPTAPLDSPWLWTSLRPPERFELTVSLPELVEDEPVSLTLYVWGQSAMPQNPDHHLRVIWNGTMVEDHFWDGNQLESWTVTLPNAVAGGNALILEAPGGTEAPVELNWIDALEISWTRRMVLDDEEGRAWHAEAEGVACWETGSADLGGFGSGEALPWVALLVDAEGVTEKAELAVDPGSGDLRVAQRAGDVGWIGLPWVAPAPDYVRPRELLVADALDDITYLIIAPRLFHTALDPLMVARRAEGYSAALITPQAVYDTFGEGIPEAAAIQALVRQHGASGGLKALLLVGDASPAPASLWDMETPGVPTAWVRTGFVGHTASDYALATGGTDEALLSVGRFPVTTGAEVEALVAKTLAWEPSPRLLLMADNEPEFADFIAQLSRVQDADLILDAAEGDIRAEMLGWLKDGPGTLIYAGHASLQLMGNEKLLVMEDRQAWRMPTVVASWSCLCAGFAHPSYQSLAEALLLGPGGVVAFVGPTGETTTAEQRAMAIAFQEALAGGETVGDALLIGWRTAISEDAQMGFLLLGDPVLRPMPRPATGEPADD